MTDVLLGADVGTSGLKLAALDPAGEVVAETESAYAVDVPRPGWAQTDVRAWRRALDDALACPTRWSGVMGNPRHEGPHVAALAALGVPPEEVARAHRPIGLDIGSRTPPEMAVATLPGLLADRNGRPGGFAHGR